MHNRGLSHDNRGRGHDNRGRCYDSWGRGYDSWGRRQLMMMCNWSRGEFLRISIARLVSEVSDGFAQELVGDEPVWRDVHLMTMRTLVLIRIE